MIYEKVFANITERVLTDIKYRYHYRAPLYDFDIMLSSRDIYESSEYMVAEVTRACYHEELGTKEVTAVAELLVPETWWDHFKMSAPSWFRRMCSDIKYKRETATVTKNFNVKMAFPDYVPPHGLTPFVRITEMKGL